MSLATLPEQLKTIMPDAILNVSFLQNELTLVIKPSCLLECAKTLRDVFEFDQLIDVAGIDYSMFGETEWETDNATNSGFSRGVQRPVVVKTHVDSRFAVAYHLLSYPQNLRVRLKVFLNDEWPEVESVTSIWPGANWFEREAFDLFGIIFRHHPDLRRILTDYGFIGHPFRKDFPLIGEVEMRYDAVQDRVIYAAVEIESRTLVPRVIRQDNRYSEN